MNHKKAREQEQPTYNKIKNVSCESTMLSLNV